MVRIRARQVLVMLLLQWAAQHAQADGGESPITLHLEARGLRSKEEKAAERKKHNRKRPDAATADTSSATAAPDDGCDCSWTGVDKENCGGSDGSQCWTECCARAGLGPVSGHIANAPNAGWALESGHGSLEAAGGFRLTGDARAYLVRDHGPSQWAHRRYVRLDLRQESLRFSLDLSKVPCGCLACIYLVAMSDPDESGSQCAPYASKHCAAPASPIVSHALLSMCSQPAKCSAHAPVARARSSPTHQTAIWRRTCGQGWAEARAPSSTCSRPTTGRCRRRSTRRLAARTAPGTAIGTAALRALVGRMRHVAAANGTARARSTPSTQREALTSRRRSMAVGR